MGCPQIFARDRLRTRSGGQQIPQGSHGFSTPMVVPRGRGQSQGIVHTVRLYGPPQIQPSQHMTNVSISTPNKYTF
jgi:hypothetical protein